MVHHVFTAAITTCLLAYDRAWAHDDKNVKRAIKVPRCSLPGAPHLQGQPRFSWGAGRALNLVDDNAGVLECVHTKQRLRLEDWGR